MPRTLVSKVILFSLPFFLLLAFGVAFAIRNLSSLETAGVHVSEHIIGQVDANGRFLSAINRMLSSGFELALGQGDEAADDLAQAQADGRAALAELAAAPDEDEFDAALNAANREVQGRRERLFEQLSQTTALIAAQAGAADSPGLAEAIETLEELENEAGQLAAASNGNIRQNVDIARQDLAFGIQRAQIAAPVVLVLFALILAATIWWLRARIARPLGALAAQADAVAGGQLEQEVAVTSDDEIGGLQRSFKMMIDNLRGQRAAIEQRNADLEAGLATQRQLLSTVQQLSTPLLPVLEGVVVLPIVGHLDAARARELTATLLEGVARQRARMAILDITGLATVDAEIIGLLIESMQAVELLGARAALAGISAAMAQVMVSQQINLQSLATYADLRTAIEAAIGGAAARN